MASTHRRQASAGHRNVVLHLLLLLVTARCVQSQSNNNNNNNSNSNPYFSSANFNPSMAIVIVVLISAFFFLGFFSIYIRQCTVGSAGASLLGGPGAAGGRSRRQRGLDVETLESFPTLVYSEVKGLKIGNGALECAVCLSEFEDNETIRLLPKCDHVFHPDCIDAWLSAHVTCPVCRANLADTVANDIPVFQVQPDPAAPSEDIPPVTPTLAPAAPAEHVVNVAEEGTEEEEQANLERIINMKRAKSRGRPVKFPRSHSTGHSLVQPGENLDRFTLRLPESVRREIMDTGLHNLQRAKSMVGERSSRRGFRVGEGSTGRVVRPVRLGRSDRWPSVLLRTLSAKMTGWGRRSEVEGSWKGEASFKGGKPVGPAATF